MPRRTIRIFAARNGLSTLPVEAFLAVQAVDVRQAVLFPWDAESVEADLPVEAVRISGARLRRNAASVFTAKAFLAIVDDSNKRILLRRL